MCSIAHVTLTIFTFLFEKVYKITAKHTIRTVVVHEINFCIQNGDNCLHHFSKHKKTLLSSILYSLILLFFIKSMQTLLHNQQIKKTERWKFGVMHRFNGEFCSNWNEFNVAVTSINYSIFNCWGEFTLPFFIISTNSS